MAAKNSKKLSSSKGKTTVKSKKNSTLKKVIKNVKSTFKLSKPKTSTLPKQLPPLEKISTAFNKSTLIATLAERTELNKKQVSLLIEELLMIIGLHVKKGGPEKFVMPGAFKIVVKKVPAKKAYTGINRFTGQSMVFKAKPASRKVKIIALKALKDQAI